MAEVPHPVKVHKPRCEDCDTVVDVQVVSRPGGVGHAWLCPSCQLLRADPEAARSQHPPGLPSTWRLRRRPQQERLFDE